MLSFLYHCILCTEKKSYIKWLVTALNKSSDTPIYHCILYSHLKNKLNQSISFPFINKFWFYRTLPHYADNNNHHFLLHYKFHIISRDCYILSVFKSPHHDHNYHHHHHHNSTIHHKIISFLFYVQETKTKKSIQIK